MLNILVNCEFTKLSGNLQGEHGWDSTRMDIRPSGPKNIFFLSSVAKSTFQVGPEIGPNFWIQPGRVLKVKNWVGSGWVQIWVQANYNLT